MLVRSLWLFLIAQYCTAQSHKSTEIKGWI